VPLVHRDQLVPLVHKVLRVNKESRGVQALQVQLVPQAHLVLLDSQDRRELQAQQDRRARLVNRARQESKGHKDHLE
jgi:hypothetical protein